MVDREPIIRGNNETERHHGCRLVLRVYTINNNQIHGSVINIARHSDCSRAAIDFWININ